jgi:crotonobetainyl-CoA:carnitine CoA-transferase CaiB-like acyl-CoA transferase
VVIAVGNDRQFGRLLTALGVEDADGRFTTNAARVARHDELIAWLAPVVAGWRRDSLVAALTRADVPAGPVNSVPEAVLAMGPGWTQRIDDVELVPSAIQLDGSAPPVRRPPPRLGQHGAEVLAELEALESGQART